MRVRSLIVPAARTADLVVSESGNDVLVYDQRSHQIHRLNPSAAAVWGACDGQRSMQDIAAIAGVARDVVPHTLVTLRNADLLDGELPPGLAGQAGSRRAFVRKLGVAGAAAVPAIVSVTAPLAAQGRSCRLPDEPCTFNDPGACCSLTCVLTSTGPRCL